ncbi:UvrD-helicase domain-containing protein [Pelagibius marinus]|uniref:UvrD-helicase domain-containing protein n=1 Tax=Pelagibius marinus TaxID=2762760 RepID=UPI0018727583|nr:UvrD-helicase domain-containing protein [Pelagibius marinus]
MTQIERSKIAGLISRLLGEEARGLCLNEAGLQVLGPSLQEVSFRDFAGPVAVTRRLWFRGLLLPLTDGSSLQLLGVRREAAESFAEAANAAWRQHVVELFDEIDPELRTLSQVVERLSAPRRYPAACLLVPYLERAAALLSRIPTQVPGDFISPEQQQRLAAIAAFAKDPAGLRDAAIETFIGTELRETAVFLDSIESNPLTPEQRLAVVSDEDATLVLAGAGSGKTSVIVAKAAYLMRQGIRQSDEILLVAFGAKAAEEMASRIETRSGAAVDARTFHALGLSIIKEAEGQAPALAPHASDDVQFRALLRDILKQEIVRSEATARLVLRWFSEFFWPYRSEWDFKTRDAYYQYIESHELRTLQGEVVRSFEECEIANWLYLNGIAYVYEPAYKHDLPGNNRRAYTPDFRLSESGVYIEHFGVRKERGPDGKERLTTAPFVDRERYLEDMIWKRQVHQEHGTTLIETYSYERMEGRLTEALAEKLAPFATPAPIPPEQIFEKLNELGRVDAFTQTLGTFLRHFKGAGLSLEACRRRSETGAEARRNKAFLDIFDPVLLVYQRRLADRIDFEDMIARATDHVAAGRYKSPYRHLLVDEFQDISEGRAKLLRALKAQHEDARIFAVGDDWQSIYRFSGSDIHLMRDFGDEFGGAFAGATGIHRLVDLGRTFRSVDKIALPARSFVLKNPSQIEKQVISAGTADAAAIKVAYYGRGQEEAALRATLEDIRGRISSGRTQAVPSVLLLGRYHHVCPKNLSKLEADYPELSIRFLTVHASKGLEADHVIILKVEADRFGFPSAIVDDPLLDMVLPAPEAFEHAEERRLFYVALTRARQSVSILAAQDRPSVFVRELVEGAEYGVVLLGEAGLAEHKCAACGGRMVPKEAGNGRRRFVCEHGYLCGASLPTCGVCGRDIPARGGPSGEEMICSCGARYPSCPSCSDGWLVERNGQYGAFLGCTRYPACKGKGQLKASTG